MHLNNGGPLQHAATVHNQKNTKANLVDNTVILYHEYNFIELNIPAKISTPLSIIANALGWPYTGTIPLNFEHQMYNNSFTSTTYQPPPPLFIYLLYTTNTTSQIKIYLVLMHIFLFPEMVAA